jgi:cytochrome bd-type quinol oxidase subunit 2
MKDLTRYLTALFALIPLSVLLYNLFEMPVKMNLSKERYQDVQGFTTNLSWLIAFEIAAMIMTVILILIEKKKKRTFIHLLIALICFVISIALFFIFILPADLTTSNWSNLPTDWEPLRTQWEYSNAGRAILSLAGFSFIILAFLKNRNYYRVGLNLPS